MRCEASWGPPLVARLSLRPEQNLEEHGLLTLSRSFPKLLRAVVRGSFDWRLTGRRRRRRARRRALRLRAIRVNPADRHLVAAREHALRKGVVVVPLKPDRRRVRVVRAL